mmetsp:Transcript_9536/g.33512  ORF Transcript_9536/g.33512 Transcript_9536/m.33512 type:complete len:230 (+) Transcript_9536:1843-2532(+)
MRVFFEELLRRQLTLDVVSVVEDVVILHLKHRRRRETAQEDHEEEDLSEHEARLAAAHDAAQRILPAVLEKALQHASRDDRGLLVLLRTRVRHHHHHGCGMGCCRQPSLHHQRRPASCDLRVALPGLQLRRRSLPKSTTTPVDDVGIDRGPVPERGGPAERRRSGAMEDTHGFAPQPRGRGAKGLVAPQQARCRVDAATEPPPQLRVTARPARPCRTCATRAPSGAAVR